MSKKPLPPTNLTNCTFTNDTSANKHTRAAVEALADAVRANAEAIAQIAKALQGGSINAPMLQLNNPTGE